MLAISAGGRYPIGAFTLSNEGGVKPENWTRICLRGEGWRQFLLGSFAWKICDIRKDTVTSRSLP